MSTLGLLGIIIVQGFATGFCVWSTATRHCWPSPAKSEGIKLITLRIRSKKNQWKLNKKLRTGAKPKVGKARNWSAADDKARGTGHWIGNERTQAGPVIQNDGDCMQRKRARARERERERETERQRDGERQREREK